jgi:F0F1-type ATP synthase assembly protein I
VHVHQDSQFLSDFAAKTHSLAPAIPIPAMSIIRRPVVPKGAYVNQSADIQTDSSTRPRFIQAIKSILMGAAIGSLLTMFASTWLYFPWWYIPITLFFAGLVGLATWTRHVRFCVALACVGCIFQPSLFPAAICDGSFYLWPTFGTVVGFAIGVFTDSQIRTLG